MAWGLGVGILIVCLLFAFFGYVIFKESRMHRFWRSKVAEGDLEMISQLVQAELERWRMERPPKGMAAAVWQGIQSVEIVDVGRDYVHASTTAEAQFGLVRGERRQVVSAVDEAKRITARLAERLFYDVPYVRPERVQIDVYSTFHEAGMQPTQRCILSLLSDRATAAEVDWDDDPPEVVAEQLGARYQLDAQGAPEAIEPERDAKRSVNGSVRDGSSDGAGGMP